MTTLLLALAAPPERVDVLVYGGTPAGLLAAVAAAREGARVTVVEPTHWLGGVVTGGLSRTDVGNPATIGGYTREFFTRAAARYHGQFLWYAEPHVNAETFATMLREAGVTTVTDAPLASVARDGRRLVGLTAGGRIWTAAQFIDASYEGDLLAAAKVGYVVGRESRAEYDEPLAGYHPMPIRPRTPAVMASDCAGIGGDGPAYIHGTPAAIPALDARGEPLYGVVRPPQLAPGAADGLTQAYNFRLCVTRRPDLRVPFPRPANYRPERYELLLRLLQAFPEVRFGRLFSLNPVAGDKYDLNAQGLVSTDLPGANTAYPDGDATTRARIWQDHLDTLQGLFWFLGHDERVPAGLRDQTNTWGLCRDEFVDHAHWPHALYVREARRLVGTYVMTQQDCQQSVTKPDSVALGSFVIDSHIVQRIVGPDGTVRDEGSFVDAPVRPYQIPYRSLTPKAVECENLLVPVCLSASHIACCSLRMEPVYMALGHAAGVAAVLALRAGQPVQGIDVAALQRKLAAQGAVLALPAQPRPTLAGSVVECDAATFTGAWTTSSWGSPLSVASRHDDNTGKGEKQATFTLRVPAAGRYEVRLAYVAADNRARRVPLTVRHAAGEATLAVDQRVPPPLDGHFVSLGTFTFLPDQPAVVTVGTAGTDGFVSVDAVQWLRAGD